ncbi:hypothetical protein HXX76_008950 [Chlamydomonas incerta]|uniref:Uncharacterized protein n=1 Tax=Chlamydomonas incerta TaxID=51695 RepID=A0A835VYI0_CHLIN|nr:hypothetical protein HXX76_008950 [Chlamydomonas incerta]|eukprot:KAG2432610.1 hypothetical protein HXX76_008950 [Chlamydomonas incerta]
MNARLDKMGSDLGKVRLDQRGQRQHSARLERSHARLMEAVVGWALRDRDGTQLQAAGSAGARGCVVLSDAASVVASVLPPELLAPGGARVEAEEQLTAWLVENHRGLIAILKSELHAVPSRLEAAKRPEGEVQKAAAAAQAALTSLQGPDATAALWAALGALSCIADLLPVSLKQLEDCAQDATKAHGLLRGELCVPALTALHPPVSGTASCTAKELEIDRLLPLRVLAAAGGKGGSSAATSGDGGSTDAGSGGMALLELQEIKSSSVGLSTARDQLARRGRVLACAYGVLRDCLPHTVAGAAAVLPELHLQGTIALGEDGSPLASAEQLPHQQELSTADGRKYHMQMSYLVLAAGDLVPWVPGRQQ